MKIFPCSIWLIGVLWTIQHYAVDQLAVVIVLDGCAINSLQQIKPFLKGGLKEFFDKGIIYNQARYPYAGLSTGPGHTTLNTGALPRDSGIVDNWWMNEGTKVGCDDADPETSAVFSPKGLYSYGKSPEHIRVDGVSDQLMIAQHKNLTAQVVALSNKSRAAICCAGRSGKAFWLDENGLHLTSSAFYFDSLPEWIKRLNSKIKPQTLRWPLMFDKNHQAYSMVLPFSYTAARPRLAGTTHNQLSPVSLDLPLIDVTPTSIQMLLQWSKKCLHELLKKKLNKLLVYISISTTDFIGHRYGPNSLEYIDMLYHIDRLLNSFIQQVKSMTKHYQTVMVLTADHGQLPIPEVMHTQGFSFAQRISAPHIQELLNKSIHSHFGVPNAIRKIDTPWVWLNDLNPLDSQKIIPWIVESLQKISGIKQAWSYDTLQALPCQPHDWISRFKNQLAPGRSAPIIFQTDPYIYCAKYNDGTGHNSPYEYSTHVPLIWYQKELPATTVNEPVWMTQLAPSLAEFFHVQRPSAALYQSLPKIPSL